MANSDLIFGAMLVGNAAGINTAQRRAIAPASYETSLFKGDFISFVGDYTNDAKGDTVVVQASAGSRITGIITGFGVNLSTPHAGLNYGPASTLREVFFVPVTTQLFYMQESGNMTYNPTGKYFDITVGSGNTSTGLSGMEIDSSTSSTSSGQIEVIELAPASLFGGNALGTNAKWLCRVNESDWS